MTTIDPDERTELFAVPDRACDCHMHVFGPPERFPAAAARSYTPQLASLDGWRAAVGTAGLRRLVAVQPSAYGVDNSCLLEVLSELGEDARGVAQIDETTTDDMLVALDSAGVRGVRLNPKSVGLHDKDGLRTLIEQTAARVASLGWHVELYATLGVIAELHGTLAHLPAPLVLDHMAGAKSADSPEALRPALDLLGAGRCWVKLSGAYRVSDRADGFGDATLVAQAFVKTNPDQILWGSDWPHTAGHAAAARRDPPVIEFRTMDERALLDLLAEAAENQATFDRILVSNADRFYFS